MPQITKPSPSFNQGARLLITGEEYHIPTSIELMARMTKQIIEQNGNIKVKTQGVIDEQFTGIVMAPINRHQHTSLQLILRQMAEEQDHENVDIDWINCWIAADSKLGLHAFFVNYLALHTEQIQTPEYTAVLTPTHDQVLAGLKQLEMDSDRYSQTVASVMPIAYSSREDYQAAVYRASLANIPSSLNHIHRCIMQEEGLQDLEGSIVFNMGGYH
jgi:hypothetical protein